MLGKPPSSEPDDGTTQLGRLAVRGAAWTGVSQGARAGISFVASLALASLLSPEAFGIFALVLLGSEFANHLIDFGIGSAIIQRNERRQEVLTGALWLAVGIGGVGATFLIGASPLFEWYFRNDELSGLFVLSGLTLWLGAINGIPGSVLARDLRYRELAVRNIAGSLCGAAVAIYAAYAGYGVWALVGQPLVGNAVSLLISLPIARLSYRLVFPWKEVAPLFKFGADMLGVSLVNVVMRHVHSLILGRRLGTQQLGLYSFCGTMLSPASFLVGAVLAKTMFPIFSRLRESPNELADAYLSTVAVACLLAMPMIWGIVLVSDDMVHLMFGEKWKGALAVLPWLAFAVAVHSALNISSALLISVGKTRLLIRLTVWGAIFVVAGLFVGSWWGLVGAAVGHAIGVTCGQLLIAYRVLRETDIRIDRLLRTIFRSVSSVLLMALCVLLVRELFEGSSWYRLVASIATGAMSYACFAWWINRSLCRRVLRMAF